MPYEVGAEDNIDRLLKHLKVDSLATRLVQARKIPNGADPAIAMKAVLTDRLEQVKAKLDGAAD